MTMITASRAPILLLLAVLAEVGLAQTITTFQPGPDEGQDAFLGSCAPCGYVDMNFGTHADLCAVAWTQNGDFSHVRSLIRFDLSSLDPGIIIDEAMLSLYFNPTSVNGDHQSLTGPNTCVLQRVTTPWEENEVTWATQPGITSVDEVILPETTTNTEDRPNIDVTAMVQQMVASPASNHGFMLRMLDETIYRRMIFASSDHSDPARWPKLVVKYEDATAVLMHVAALTLPVHPVPFSTTTSVDLTALGPVPVTLMLTDINGRIVMTQQVIGGTSVTLRRDGLACGSYILSAGTTARPDARVRLVVD